MKQEPIEIQWIKHVKAMYEDGPEKDIIEDVSLSAADGIRGAVTGKTYDMPAAIKMNEKYDRLAEAKYFDKETHKDKLSPNEVIIAMATGSDAANYHKQDPKLIKNYNELRAKRNRILNQVKIEKKRKNQLLENWGLKKKDPDLKSKMRKWIQEADDEKLVNSKILKNNINKKKKIKVASKPKPNGFDTEPNVIPIGPIPHSRPWYEDVPSNDDDAAFRFPPKEKYSIIDKIVLHADLQKAYDKNSGIGRYDKRKRMANGGNGSTADWDEKHPFTKRIQDIYGIQLTGQETLEELLKIVSKLNEK
tara:strand:- start:53 stop:967 length:915 start_codon:yes stop_codon:yes gene_type:complete